VHNSYWTRGNEAAIRSPEDLVKKPEGSPDFGLPKKYVRKILFKLDYFSFRSKFDGGETGSIAADFPYGP